MGFFDDLDDELEVPADLGDAAPDADGLGLVADKLATGWVYADRISTPGKDDGEWLDQEFELSFRGGRYIYTTRLVKRRGKWSEAEGETVRNFDRAGLIELLSDQRLLGRKAIVSAGGKAPEIDPRSF